jgi:hypothetical protein
MAALAPAGCGSPVIPALCTVETLHSSNTSFCSGSKKQAPAGTLSMLRRALLFPALLLPLLQVPSSFAQSPQSSGGQEPSQPQRDAPQRERMRGDGVIGRVQSVSGDEMKLTQQDGQVVTVRISPHTVFRIDRREAKLGDFNPGMNVFVRGTKNAENVWDAELVAARTGPPMMEGLGKEFVVGEVKSIDGTKITVLRPDSVTQTIEADENTSLKKHGESITLADIQEGDSVMARGELKDRTFVPKTLTVMNPEQAQRMKQFMGTGDAPGANSPASTPKPTPTPSQDQKPPSRAKPPQEPR